MSNAAMRRTSAQPEAKKATKVAATLSHFPRHSSSAYRRRVRLRRRSSDLAKRRSQRSSRQASGEALKRLKLTLAYDGTLFAGWQVQPNGRSVQGEIEAVLRKVLRRPTRVTGSGRTDAGVHALAQVAHIDVPSAADPFRLLRSVNSLLPKDISLLSVEPAPADFHARFSAKAKHYRYRMFLGEAPTPFDRPYVHVVRAKLSVAKMKREAKALVGRHDFRAFARAGSGKGGTVRTIMSAKLTRRGDELVFDIVGEGFLHNMVRSIVGTLIDVGRGRLPAGTVSNLLRGRSLSAAGTTASSSGLILVNVGY